MPTDHPDNARGTPYDGGQRWTAVPVGAAANFAARPMVAVPAIPIGPASVRPAASAKSRPRADRRDPFRGRRKFAASFGGSAVFHFVLVLVAGLWTTQPQTRSTGVFLSASHSAVPVPNLDSLVASAPVDRTPQALMPNSTPQQVANRIVEQRMAGRNAPQASKSPEPRSFNPSELGQNDLLTEVAGSPYGMLDGRDGELKRALLRDATEESEQAVYAGLKWLAAHQREDGSWHFNHLNGSCRYCRNPGNHGSTTAATGLALLPFLGAGHTHLKDGEFKETVRKGLHFLMGRMLATPLGGDLQDGSNLYSQGIATLALCEAYAMTRDRELYSTCADAAKFIVSSQHTEGGWRYFPGQVGDTTVTGWMLMGLKSAQLGYVPVPPGVWTKASKFLDSVQDDDGAAYGYQSPSRDEPTMTAIGLLCRMYGGWPRSRSSLARGVRSLGKRGPSQSDMYFDYYATQVMHHYGGNEWQAWNVVMREQLVKTQDRRGHESGSWYFPDKHGDQGGRLYNTAMAIMILEVYYRYMPIYGDRALIDTPK